MRIQIKKNHSKPCILTCIRDDESVTWAKLHQGMEAHDLAHYAVEKVLGFDQAFFGLLNKGYEIGDFELPKDKRPSELQPINLHASALQTEHIVNLLTVEFFNTGVDGNFLETLRSILAENQLSYPDALTEDTLKEIRTMFTELLYRWGALGDGEVLELELSF